MATADRPASDHLTFLAGAAAEARRYGFFALLRQAEALRGPLPRIGQSRLPQQNLVDLAHSPELVFPGSTIESLERTRKGRARVRSLFLGLTGPMGALPLHLTEFAQYERRYGAKQPFGEFLDLLTNRMLQLFYRAWADSQPAVHADGAHTDRFAGYLSTFVGQSGGMSSAALPLNARLHYLGQLLSRRSPASIIDFLSHLFGRKVTVREFVPAWRVVEGEDQTRIGCTGLFNRLGQGAVLGKRARMIDDRIVVAIETRDLADYARFLPVEHTFAVAADALDAIVPDHIEWQLELQLDEKQAEGAVLGKMGQLGWTTWLAPLKRAVRRTDLRLERRHIAFCNPPRREAA
jgi:type VI secretion system ImpH/TssG family protein